MIHILLSSNSIQDVYALYGVVAARNKIKNELKAIISGANPNTRHLYIMADTITMTGRLTSFEKNGLAVREKNNILLRIATSAPVVVINDAVHENLSYQVYGVSSALVLGTVPKIGTLYSEIAVDSDFIKENVKTANSIVDQI